MVTGNNASLGAVESGLENIKSSALWFSTLRRLHD